MSEISSSNGSCTTGNVGDDSNGSCMTVNVGCCLSSGLSNVPVKEPATGGWSCSNCWAKLRCEMGSMSMSLSIWSHIVSNGPRACGGRVGSCKSAACNVVESTVGARLAIRREGCVVLRALWERIHCILWTAWLFLHRLSRRQLVTDRGVLLGFQVRNS